MLMASSSGRFCDNCDHRHILTAAVTWCPDCDEALCSECKDHHDASKIAKFHTTISITEFDKLPSFIKETSVYCTDHDQRCELYCRSHRQVCCIVCLTESHFHCEKPDILQAVVKNIKTSPALEDIENDLKCIMASLDSLIHNRNEHRTQIYEQQLSCMKELQSVRKLVNDKLDEMENSLKDTITSDAEDLSLFADGMLEELDFHKQHISTLQEELKTSISIATDLQVFLGLKQLEIQVEEELSYLETLKTNKYMDEVDIVLEISPTVTAISEGSESFGVILQSRKCNDLEFGVRKKEQAQILLPSVNKLSNITFFEKAKFQLPIGEKSIDVVGCTVLPGELLVFADGKNNRLVIYDSDGTFKRNLLISFSPSGIAHIDRSTVGVTSSSAKKVVLIELTTGKELHSFSTGESCYGLSFLNKMLTIRIPGSFLRMTLDGAITSMVKAKCKTHCCATDDCILSSNYENNSVLCFKMNGDHAWQFQDPNLQCPCGVFVVEDGFVLVTGEISNNIFVISPDGQNGREILKTLDKPYAIHFDKASKLIVTASRTGSAKVMKVYQKK